eukprot:485046_1
MSKGKGNFKGFGSHDVVECTICGKRMERRCIKTHYETYAIAKDGYPNHPNTSNTIHELQDPTDYNSKILKTKSINTFFTPIKSKKRNQSNKPSIHSPIPMASLSLSLNPNYKHKQRNRKPPLQPKHSTIEELFNEINNNILHENKLTYDQKYFEQKTKLLMKKIKG